MLDFSLAELVLVVAVAVIFLRPSDVPVVVRAIAKLFAQMKKLSAELRGLVDELARESGLEEARRDIKTITGLDGKQHETYDIEDFLKK